MCKDTSLNSQHYTNLFLHLQQVKTQLQSQSAQNIAVGYQHNHTNSWSAFKALWREGGIAALYRGWHANIPRLFVGSATQLTAFGMVADWLRSLEVSISINIAASQSSIETYLLSPRCSRISRYF